jgi:peptidase E
LYTPNGVPWTNQYRINNGSSAGNGAGTRQLRRRWSPAATVHAGERATGNFGPLYNDDGAPRGDHSTMEKTLRQIVAFGGGGFSMESGNPLLDDYVLGLCRVRRPKVCFLPSASGDADHYVVRFYRAFAADRCEASHVSLFRREQGPEDLRAHLLEQDLIYVGGGSVVSMLGVWQAHGIDRILREAWERGVVLCGLSAGSLCWFAEAVTGFHGAPRRVEGLGLLPFSNCVHYEPGSDRRLAYHQLLREGMRAGYAAEDGAALHFTGTELGRVVASRPAARGFRLEATPEAVVETQVATVYLGDPAAPQPSAMSTALAA